MIDLFTPTLSRQFVGVDPKQIEWVWIVEAKRHATPKEIADLCKRKG
jgi:hypothetical protein